MIHQLDERPYYKQLASCLKPIQLQELVQAIDAEDKEQIKTVMFKYCRKREAEALYPVVIEDLNKMIKKREIDEMKKSGFYSWSQDQICEYLKDKLEMDEREEVSNIIKMGELDLCKIIIYDYLRFDEANFIFPHIQRFILSQNSDKIQPKKQASPQNNQEQILVYIEQKVSPQQFQEIKNLLKFQYIEETVLLVKNLLRKKEAEYIIPKIQSVFGRQKSGVTTPQRKMSDISLKLEQDLDPNPEKFSKTFTTKFQDKRLKQGKSTFAQKMKKQLSGLRQAHQQQKQDQKTLLKKIKQEFGYEAPQQFETVKQLIIEKKLTAAFEIVKDVKGRIVADRLIKLARAIIDEVKNQPMDNSVFLMKNPDGIQIYELQTQPMLDGIPESAISNVLIVGMTGVGKSTFLNSLVNKLMGIEMTDSFRYVIINDMLNENKLGQSLTNEVNIYGIPKQGKMKKAIRLIDAPGLGDTAGLKKDQENIDKIKRKIESSIPYLNMVIYVFKSSETRITKESEYVMGQVMGLFGKDIAPNILFVLTFADNMEPNVKASLETSFQSIIQKIQQKHGLQWFIKVNNSALFKKIDPNDPVDISFYNMGSLCLQKAVNRIFSSDLITTHMTQNVLKKREDIEMSLKAFNALITVNIQKQREIQKLVEQVVQDLTYMKNTSYKVKYKEEKIKHIDTKNNVTSCINCKFSCHENCIYANNQEKEKCYSMTDGFCRICPDKCHWTSHINEHFIIKREMVQVQKTNQDLYKQYQISEKSKNKGQQLLVGLISEYTRILASILDSINRIRQANEELDKIQLRKVNKKTIVEYIEILIQNEKIRMEAGYLERVSQYMIIKKQQERADQALNKSQADEIKKFEQLIKENIDQLIPDKKIAQKMLTLMVQLYMQQEPVQRKAKKPSA